MRKLIPHILMTTTALMASTALAEPKLIAIGTLTGMDADLSGLTGTLENGLPAAILQGTGSGIAWAGGDTFLSLPDRGPNATVFNAKIDNTVTYIPRFSTLTLALTPAAAGSAVPFDLKADITATTLLWSEDALVYGTGEGLDVASGIPEGNAEGKNYFSGRSDAYDKAQNSCNPLNGRFDPEGIRVSADGSKVYISDEYGPYLYEFDKATGERTMPVVVPANLCSSDVLSPVGQDEIDGNKLGRVANKGMEGLAITPDGKTLVGVMQAALAQDAADKASKKMIRIVTIDIASGDAHEYGYMLTDGSGVSEILAVNDHQFLLGERDGAGLGDGSAAEAKKFFLVDLTGATDITDVAGGAAMEKAVAKTEFFDLVKALGARGVAPEQVPAKIEGMAFGQDVEVDGAKMHTLYISNDNDFLPEAAGPNTFYVVGFTDADLPGVVTQ